MSTYVFLGLLLYDRVGLYHLMLALAVFVGAQLLRLLPSTRLRELITAMNYWCVLWTYRINYLCTLTLSIALCLTPFVAGVYGAGLYGGMAFGGVTALVFGLIFVYVQYRRTAADSSIVTSWPGATRKKTVAVIGGGVAGIVAAKECLQEGHDVVVYEKASCLGGVWNPDDAASKRTTGRTLSSSSRYNSFFGDFPMNLQPLDTPEGRTYPSHYTEADYRDYLYAYTEHFGLEPHFRFNTSVEATERTDDGAWHLRVRDNAGRVETHIHDFVIVATGLNHETQALTLSQDDGATANDGPVPLKMAHAASYRSNEQYRDKKVVIVGMGESSSDLAADIASVAREVHVIVRSPVLLLPRNTFGKKVAPDHKLSRLVLSCPQFVRTWKLMSQTVMHGPLNWVASNVLGLRNVFGVSLEDGTPYHDNWSWEWWKLFYKLGFWHPKARWGLTRGQVTKTAPIVRAYRQGKLHFHTADIETTEHASVVLEDGTRIEGVEEMVNATGYTPVWPFLPAGYATHNSRDRYRLVFHPELPGMAFVGFCRGAVGSVMQAMEMQARWVALVVSEKRELPDEPAMQGKIIQHKQQMVGKWPTKVTMVYVNALARHEVGCEPRLADVFRMSPKVWYYLMSGPYCMAMYRFRGPHANPELARQVYASGPDLVWPLEFYLQQTLELTLGYLTRFWSSLPPLAGMKTRSPVCRALVTPFLDLEY